jgi:carboxypeptidase C (cathepsin A)
MLILMIGFQSIGNAATPEEAIPVPAETSSVTKSDIRIDGELIHYTATAGNLLIQDEKGAANASIFYVAYTQDRVDAKIRPITFFFNGGPGSSTIWLHMGSFAPVRVITRSPQATGPAPYEIVPNEYSLLDHSDLVFIDPPLCGFSRAVGKGTLADFAGTDEDIRAFKKFIIRYISSNQRWNSPKYLFGESYGTTRAAGLVDALQNDGVDFNGVVLLSSILNANRRAAGLDNEAIGYLPSFAAIAYYHKKVNTASSLKDWVEEAREFARGPYAEAIAQGDRLAHAQFDLIAEKLAALTGLSVRYVKEAKLRISPSRFRKELLRTENGRILGRLDARFMGWDPDAAGEYPDYDPMSTGVRGAYTAAFHDYLLRTLKYVTSEPYYVSGPDVARSWNFKHHAPESGDQDADQNVPDVAIDLADAMRKNPRLEVFSANGYFDLGTPFFPTEFDLSHMQLPAELVGNVKFGYYESGHMVYLNVESLRQMKRDLAEFYSQ